jgi:hypothetical protein
MLGIFAVPWTGFAGCTIELDSFTVWCRTTINGTDTDYPVPIYLDAGAAGNTNSDDWGSATVYLLVDEMMNPCNTGKQNCDGDDYSYADVTVNNAWSLTHTVNGVEITSDVDDNDAYWDERYDGYTQNGAVDYTQNCHGYAFGVGDWPDDNADGHDILLEVGTCYVNASVKDAILATCGTHSIKVTGDECSIWEFTWEITDSTSEKFRESGIYEQSNGCNTGVDVAKAHPGQTFNFYKLKPP